MKSALKQDYESPRAYQSKANPSLMNGDAFGSQVRLSRHFELHMIDATTLT